MRRRNRPGDTRRPAVRVAGLLACCATLVGPAALGVQDASAAPHPIRPRTSSSATDLAGHRAPQVRGRTASWGSSAGRPATTGGWGRTRPTTSPTPPPGNPFSSRQLYVDPSSLAATALRGLPDGDPDIPWIAKIAGQPQAAWFDYTRSGTDVGTFVAQANAVGRMPVLVAYAVPDRDCGGSAPWTAPNATAYHAWITALAQAIGSTHAAVILEPDALALLSDARCAADVTNREPILADAVTVLRADAPDTAVYLDAGHSGWVPAATMADRLSGAGVANARGFSLNVSNFFATSAEISYGDSLSALTGTHYVVDTSRNGLATAADNWCNPAGQALGTPPTATTGSPSADAYLWIKRPGESDGVCNPGEPTAGSWFESYAVGLAQLAAW